MNYLHLPQRKTAAHLAVGITLATMASRYIADLTQKRHDSVKRTIDTLVDRGLIGVPQTVEYLDPLGRPAQEYLVGKRDSYVIVAQLSPEFTAKLVDRWQELEAGVAPSLPKTMAEALRLAADQSEQLEAQAAQLALAAPKAEFVDQYVVANGNRGFREVCKLLKANERQFGRWLEAAGITYWLAGERTAYAQHIHAGRFVIKTGVAGGEGEEGGHAFTQLKWTPKGVQWTADQWAKHQETACTGSSGGRS